MLISLKFHLLVYPGSFRYINILYIAILYFVSENSNICNFLKGMSKFATLLVLIQVSLLSLMCLVIFNSVLLDLNLWKPYVPILEKLSSKSI